VIVAESLEMDDRCWNHENKWSQTLSF